MSSEIASSIPREERARPARRSRRVLAVHLLGPLTMVSGLVWAVAQPYRIVLLDRAGQGLWDYLFQPPLLVIAVGLVFTVLVAPGLVEDLEAEEECRDPAR